MYSAAYRELLAHRSFSALLDSEPVFSTIPQSPSDPKEDGEAPWLPPDALALDPDRASALSTHPVVAKTALDKAREAPGSTKARILEAAEAVFAERGFSGASTREIAARAGVNISSLHYHWSSKEALYVAVFRNVFEHIVGVLSGILTRSQGDGDRDALVDRVMAVLFDYFADQPHVPKLLMRRVLEGDDIDFGVQRDVLVPAWAVFDQWLVGHRPGLDETESRLVMLSIQSVVLVYLLDSQAYASLLGGSVREPPLRERVRAHVTRLVHALVAA